MIRSVLEKHVEELVREAEKPRPLSELEAWALAHKPELIACIRDLLRYIDGTRVAMVTLTVKATRLLDAVSPLLTPPHGLPRGFVGDAIEGEAPDLRPAAEALLRYFEDDFTLHHDRHLDAMKPSPACRAFIAEFEATRLHAYPDPASPLARNTPQMRKRWGFEPASKILAELPRAIREMSGSPWTIGTGHTGGVKPDDQVTPHQASVLFEHDVDTAWASAQTVIRVPVTQGMCDAISSFVQNIGLGAKGVKDGFAVLKSGAQSTILRKLNAGDYVGARKEIPKWDRAGGEEMTGLARRRAGEYAMWGDTAADFSNVQAGSDTTAPAN